MQRRPARKPLGRLHLGAARRGRRPRRRAHALLREDGAVAQWLHPGFKLVLHKDETEGYYSLTSRRRTPRCSCCGAWKTSAALPLDVTVSSDEAGRWLDGGHSVDGVAMPPEIFAWVGDYVEKNYRPQPKKRIKPRSFQHPKDRL